MINFFSQKGGGLQLHLNPKQLNDINTKIHHIITFKRLILKYCFLLYSLHLI